MLYCSLRLYATFIASVVFPCPLDALITVILLLSIDFLISLSKTSLSTGNPLEISLNVGFLPS